MNRQRFLITLILGASLTWAAGGDSGVALKSAGGAGHLMRVTFGGPSFDPQTVVGAPYSAELVMERSQSLSNGAGISMIFVPRLTYRDSQGRTRTERWVTGQVNSDSNRSSRIVQIVDPIAGYHYVLDPEEKVAHRVKIRDLPVETRGGASESIVSIAPFPVEPAGPSVSPRWDVTTEPLGTQSIDGIPADGRRHKISIPAGGQGNSQPIVSTYETWIAQDLKIVILTRRTNPRDGVEIMRFTNISRAEPDPALFRPPSGYKIVDEEGEFTIEMTRP